VEIITYWNVETLYQFFNGVAAIMNSSAFTSAARIAIGVSLLFGLRYWLNGKLSDYISQYALAIVFFMLFTTAKSDVLITDRTGQEPPKVVGNVPTILAGSVLATNAIGTWLTYTYEATFNIPAEIGIARGDFGFGHRILKNVNRVKIADAGLNADIMQFIKECTLYDIKDGVITENELLKSTNSWETIFNNSSPARFVTIGALSGAQQLETCTGAGALLQIRVNDGIAAAERFYGRNAFSRTDNDTVAAGLYANAIATSYSWVLGASANSSDAIKQAMFNNLWREAGSTIPAMLNDPARVGEVGALMSQAAAARAADGANSSLGLLAQESIPHIRNWMQAILLGFFPVFVLLMLVMANEERFAMMKGYLKTLVWVELIPVTFAMINHLSLIILSKKMAALKLATTNGVTFQLSDVFDATIQDEQSMLGAMVVAAPFITWGLIHISSGQISGLIDRTFAGTSGANAGIAPEMSRGNLSMGNMSLDNRSLNNSSHFKFDSTMGLAGGGANIAYANGSTASFSANGTSAISQMQGALVQRISASNSVSSGTGTNASDGASATQGQQVTDRSYDQAGFSQSFDNGRERSANQGVARRNGTNIVGGVSNDRVLSEESVSSTARNSTTNLSEGSSRSLDGQLGFGTGGGRSGSGAAGGGSSGSGAGSPGIPSGAGGARSGGGGKSGGFAGAVGQVLDRLPLPRVNLSGGTQYRVNAETGRNFSASDGSSDATRSSESFNFSVQGVGGTDNSTGLSSSQTNRENRSATQGNGAEYAKSSDSGFREDASLTNSANFSRNNSLSIQRDLERDPAFIEKVARSKGMTVARFAAGGTEYMLDSMQQYASQREMMQVQMPRTFDNGKTVPTSADNIRGQFKDASTSIPNNVSKTAVEAKRETGFRGTQSVSPDMTPNPLIGAARNAATGAGIPTGPQAQTLPKNEQGIDVRELVGHDKEVGTSKFSTSGAAEEVFNNSVGTGVENALDALTGKKTGIQPKEDPKK
jgi:conjugal transfer mating pair stabilization protein TraG